MAKSLQIGDEIIEIRSEDVIMDDIRRVMSEHADQKDFMTGFYNQDTFTKIVNEYGENHNNGCALFVFKINEYSTVTDQLGSFQADGLLMRVAIMVEEKFGNLCMGRLFREIFGILLPDCESVKEAEEFGKELCREIVVWRKNLKCTLTVGATLKPAGMGNFDQMYKEAFNALFDAQRIGTEQCVVYTDDKRLTDEEGSIDLFVESYGMSTGVVMEKHLDGFYIVDPVSYEILYLNEKMKEILEIEEPIIGKKCYEVIEKLGAPCKNCSSVHLQEAQSFMWHKERDNKAYIVKDSLRIWHGRLVKVSRYIDVSNPDKLKKNMHNSMEMEYTLKECIDNMISGENVSYSYKKVLKLIGNYYDAENASIYEVDEECNVTFKYVWESEYFKMMKSDNTIELSELINDSLFKINTNEQLVSYISDVEYLKDENPRLYSQMQDSGVKSVMFIEMVKNNSTKGFVVLYNPKKNIHELSILVIMASYIVNEMVRTNLWNQRTYELTHDGLTGCYNRLSYSEFVNEIRDINSLGYIIADVNGMRDVNETIGYEYGNTIIKQVADILKNVFVGFPVFRFGGDDFIICCVDISNKEFEELIAKAKARLSEHERGAILGYVWDDFDIDVKRMEEHANELLLLEKRNQLMEKDAAFESSHNKMTTVIINHISNNDFKVYLQPKFNMKTGSCIGAEALIRLMHPENGLMSPGSFIPVFERTGTIHLVDLFVFERVCQILEDLNKNGYELFPVSFNFSRITLMNNDLFDKVEEIASRYDVPRKYLEIEITESIGDLENNMIRTIAQGLHDRGFRLSMDDFGTKYSSISMISLMQCEILKIDRSMVNDIEDNNISRKVVLHVVAMCKDLGIECIAEGVETDDQAKLLLEMGCTNAQGYLYGKPVPEEEFLRKYIYKEHYNGRY